MRIKYNPTHIFTETMKLKYRMMIPSIVIIIGSFLANFYIETSMLRWLAATALLMYFIVFWTFRLRRLVPPEEPNALLSPVCGKVKAVEEHPTETVIVIRKSMFDPADVRSALDGERPADPSTLRSESGDMSWRVVSGKLHLLDSRPGLQGRLVGVFAFSGECRVTVSKQWKVEVAPGAPVLAGETVLARTETSQKEDQQ